MGKMESIESMGSMGSMEIHECCQLGCLHGYYAAWEMNGKRWQTRIYQNSALAMKAYDDKINTVGNTDT